MSVLGSKNKGLRQNFSKEITEEPESQRRVRQSLQRPCLGNDGQLGGWLSA